MKAFYFLLLSTVLLARTLSVNEVNPDKYVILIGSYQTIEESVQANNEFPDLDTFTYETSGYKTSRVVNIDSFSEAKKILHTVRKKFPSALLWKKMTFLKDKENLEEQKESLVPTKTKKFKQKEIDNKHFAYVIDKETILRNLPDDSATEALRLTPPAVIEVDKKFDGKYLVVYRIKKNGVDWKELPSPLWVKIK